MVPIISFSKYFKKISVQVNQQMFINEQIKDNILGNWYIAVREIAVRLKLSHATMENH